MAQKFQNRITWIDNAKAIGIILVFYGHIIERFYNAGYNTVFSQYKFIYSFHMILFFFVAGFFLHHNQRCTANFFLKILYQRMLIVVLFSLLCLPFWLFHYHYFDIKNIVSFLIKTTFNYLKGIPTLNWPTWFLVCLFTTEIYTAIVVPKIKSKSFLIVIAIITLSAGLKLTKMINAFNPMYIPDNLLNYSIWFLPEATVAFGFYILGYITFKWINVLSSQKALLLYGLFIASAFLTLIFCFNNVPIGNKKFVVIISLSQHGDSLYFIFAALWGTFMCLFLAMVIPQFKILKFIGQNTLTLMGLNGLFFHFINSKMIKLICPRDNSVVITFYAIFISIISIALCCLAIAFFSTVSTLYLSKKRGVL